MEKICPLLNKYLLDHASRVIRGIPLNIKTYVIRIIH